MMARVSQLCGLALRARGGQTGSVSDLLVEDDTWRVRWLVVHTGSWLFGRQALIAVRRLGPLDVAAQSLPVDLDVDEIERRPGIDADPPVSRRMEEQRFGYRGRTPFGLGDAYAGFLATAVFPDRADDKPPRGPSRSGRANGCALRSVQELTGYTVRDDDGERLGHVTDLEIDGEAWSVQSLVVETGIPGVDRDTRFPSGSVVSVSWEDQTVILRRATRTFADEAGPNLNALNGTLANTESNSHSENRLTG